MKQQYRYTKPIRGKDPDNKQEELSEVQKEVCPKCGGYGGMHQSDSPFEGYLPCYACGL